MNPEAKDWLDTVLASRDAATAPPAFTQKVMQRVAVEKGGGRARLQSSTRWQMSFEWLPLLVENALPLGLALVAGGFFSVADVALVYLPAVAVAAVGVAWYVMSQTLDPSES